MQSDHIEDARRRQRTGVSLNQRTLAFVTLIGLGTACNWGGVDCTLSEAPGISVTVVDSVTDAAILRGYTVIVSDGAYRDSTTVPADGPENQWGVQSALERPGVYTVTVRVTGYREWIRTGIRVRAGECHVQLVDVVARIQATRESST